MIRIQSGKEIFTVKDCRSLLSAMHGLMFDSLNHDGALILGGSIWMPFVKKPLHLVFLSKELTVTSVQYAVPITLNPTTWKTYSDKNAKYCLELARKPKLAQGMRIKILP
ncbi:MAG: DUF192 domain-containing protein [Candidatus Aenigmarchaeota archaeon]|nr:DUF192 domain-containing protein [Candidatus Aenigmarchaeota archaeon]